jgi:gliding motility-associated-like protein
LGNDLTVSGITNGTGISAPTYEGGLFNGQPALRFNKPNSNALGNVLNADYAGDFTLFIVLEGVADAPVDFDSFFSSWDVATNTNSFQIDLSGSNFQVRTNDGNVAFGTRNNELSLFTAKQSGTTLTTFSDGRSQNSSDISTAKGFNAYRIGVNRNGDQFYDSYIAEVIVFHRALDDCDLESVNDYLGTKYGRDFNDLSSNFGFGSTHPGDVTGIGALSSACSGNKQINTAQSSIIELKNPSSNNAVNEFITIGHDNSGLTEIETDLPLSLSGSKRLAQEWKTDEDGDLGTVDLSFDLSQVTVTGVSISEFRLLIDQDGDGEFTTGNPDIIQPTSFINQSLTFAGVDLNNDQVITLLTEFGVGPADVKGADLWLRADQGITKNGNNLTGWTDQVGRNTFTIAGNPQVANDAINYQPVVVFDGTDDFLTGNNPISFHTLYLVTKLNTASGQPTVISSTTASDGSINNQGYFAKGRNLRTGNNAASYFQSSVDLGTEQARLSVLAIQAGQDASNQVSIVDGKTFATSVLSTDGTFNPFSKIPYVGRSSDPGQPDYYNGQIAELLMYPAAHTDTQRKKIQSYLAIKYGITLDPSVGQYLSSSGTAIWNNAKYWNDVFGLGKDAASLLDQSSSNSINTGSGNGAGLSSQANIILSNPSSMDNGDFLILGHNGRSLNLIRTSITGFGAFERDWKVKRTGDIGTVTLSIDLNGLTVTGSSTNDFRLLIDVDGDGNFSTGTINRITPTRFAGNVVEFENLMLSDGAVFTLAETVSSNLTAGRPPNRIIVNPGFETGSIVPHNDVSYPESQIGDQPQIDGWYSTHPTFQNAEGAIEHWRSGFNSIPSKEGNYHVELNVSQSSRLYQFVYLVNGESVDWAYGHRARVNTNETVKYSIYSLDGSQELLEINRHTATSTSTWDDVSGTLIWNQPTGVYQIGFESTTTGGSGNFLDGVNIVLKAFVEFTVDTLRISEGGNLPPYFFVNGQVQRASSFQVAVVGGDAVEGTDFSFTNKNRNIPVGDYSLADSLNLNFSSIDNSLPQNDRTVILEIDRTTGDVDRRDANADGFYQRTLVIIIEDDDACKDPGNDANLSLCASDGSNLNFLSTLGAEAGGGFRDVSSSGLDLSNPAVVDVTALSVGTYTFRYGFSQLGICPADSSELNLEIRAPFPAGEDATIAVCNTSGNDSRIDISSKLGGAPQSGGVWTTIGNVNLNLSDPTNINFSSLSAGTYTLIYAVANAIECDGSPASSKLTVEVIQSVNAGQDNSVNVCDGGSSTSVNFSTALLGTPDTGGTWTETSSTSSGVSLANLTAVDFDGVTAGRYTFNYVVTGTSPCANDTSTLVVNVNQDHNPGTNGTREVCNGQFSLVNLFANLGGSPDPGGSWSDINGTGVSLKEPDSVSFAGITAGTYNFRYTIAGEGACNTVSADLAVTVTPAPNAGNDNTINVCDGGNSTIINLQTSLGGTPQAGGTWSETSPVSSSVSLTDPTQVDFKNVPSGKYTFRYSITGQGACSTAAATVTVNVNQDHDAGTPAIVQICNERGARLDLFGSLGGNPDVGGSWWDISAFPSSTSLADPTMVSFENVPAGQYEFEYRIAGEGVCNQVSSSVSVLVSEAIDPGEDASLQVCNADGLPVNLYQSLGGQPVPGGQWVDVDGAGVPIIGNITGFTGVAAGTYRYQYVVSTPQSCTPQSSTLTITVGESVDAGENGLLVVCDGGSSTVRNLNAALGGSPDAGGQWNDLDGSGVNLSDPTSVDFAGIPGGIYRFSYVIDAKGSCRGDSAVVSAHVDQVISSGTPTTVSVCGQQGIGIDLITLLEGNPSSGGAWSFTSSNQFDISRPTEVDFNSIEPGDYQLVYSVPGDGSCIGASTSMALTVDPPLSAGESGSVVSVCNDGEIINLSDLFSDSISAGGSYIDVDNSGVNLSQIDSVSFTGVAPGDYRFTYTVSNTCGTVEATNTVRVLSEKNPGESAGIEVCNDDTAVNLFEALGGTPDSGGYWSDNNNSGVTLGDGTSVDFSGVKKGKYRYIYHLDEGCTPVTAFVDVTLEGLPFAGIDNTVLICNENPTVNFLDAISITSSFSSEWSDVDGSGVDLTNLESIDFSGVADGRFRFLHTAPGQSVCGESTAELVVLFNTAGNAGTSSSLQACTNSTAVDLTSVLGTFDKGGSWTDLDASGVDLFTPSQVDFSNAVAGTYRFVYNLSAEEGCSSSASSTVTVNVSAASSGGFDNTVALCSTKTLDLLSSLGGTPDSGGTWTESTSSGVDLTNPSMVDFAGVADGRYVFNYLLENSTCGNTNTTLVVRIGQSPNAGNNQTLTVCQDEDNYDLLSLLGNIDPGGRWSDLDGLEIDLSNPSSVSFLNASPGLHRITYSFDEQNGCSSSASTLNVFVDEVLNAGESTFVAFCEGEETEINLFDALEGLPDPGGTWVDVDNTGVSLANPDSVNVSTLSPGEYHFNYLLRDEESSCGTSVSSVVLTIIGQNDAGFATLDEIELCNIPGTIFDLTSNLENYDNGGSWIIEGQIIEDPQNFNIGSLQSGYLEVDYVFDATQSCTGSISRYYLNIGEGANAGQPGMVQVCNDRGEINLFGAIQGTYDVGGAWTSLNNVNIDISDPSAVDFTGIDSGSYVFRYSVFTTGDCTDTVSNEITVRVSRKSNAGESRGIIIGLGDDPVINLLDSLGGSPDSLGIWVDESGAGVDLSNPAAVDFNEVADGSYAFSYYTGGGDACDEDYSILKVNVRRVAREVDVLVTDGFSPNDDGINDVWNITYIEQFPRNNVRLYNRWGELVYEMDGYNNLDRAFDGIANQNSLSFRFVPDGTYYYIIDLGTGQRPITGFITILK